MSLTSYRAAPPRVKTCRLAFCVCRNKEPPEVQALQAVKASRYVISFAVKRRIRETCLTYAFCRPGSDLLSRALRQSTIGAEAFHGRVRDGIGCSHFAITTRSAKSI